ncbi:pimeloyl-CoA dehydrogenase [Saccharibacter sp. 17.LH.SD]|uniref:pirin family protein n=1 Tax=Saccharibacter sp. 17.LH.SD TaxID=2689393 RepID=UPI0013701726|nr:pirin family protein [Saccharibacter sp. 17.LH.SD]MXV44359.1 pimeloyl-CoA dehydrogenase [Saccharibacter sp. 17.LH.SD]
MNTPFKFDQSTKHGKFSGGFGVEILYPGLALSRTDSGLGAIGKIDHASFHPGSIVPMHPHKDDEILTYMRSGEITHRDTVGHVETVTPQRLMLMNAGHTFKHEETIEPAGGKLKALQIFMRPREANLKPKVQFHDFGNAYSVDQWRLIAGPHDAPLILRADASIYDTRLEAGETLALPQPPKGEIRQLLYVFEGEVTVAGHNLKTGESLLLDGHVHDVEAIKQSDLVLFVTDLDAPIFKGGLFSGNLFQTNNLRA